MKGRGVETTRVPGQLQIREGKQTHSIPDSAVLFFNVTKMHLKGLKRKAVPRPLPLPGVNSFYKAGNLGTDDLGGPASLAVSWGKPCPWNGEIMNANFIF